MKGSTEPLIVISTDVYIKGIIYEKCNIYNNHPFLKSRERPFVFLQFAYMYMRLIHDIKYVYLHALKNKN